MLAIKIIATILIGYMIGVIHPSYVISLIMKKDLKATGTKNYGASNTFVVAGKKWGVIVALLDIGKGALATLIPMWIFPDLYFLQYVGGSMAVIGHIFPFYLKFDGGKGFAAYIGMMLAINWIFGLIALVTMLVVTIIINYRLAATFFIIFVFPIFVAVYYREWIGFGCVTFTTAVIVYKHITNIKHTIAGREVKVRDLITGKKGFKDDKSLIKEEDLKAEENNEGEESPVHTEEESR